MLVRPKALNDLRLQNLVQDRLYQLRKPILTAQKSWQEILANVNIIPSHRFAPSVKNVSESSSTEPKRWLPTSEFTALYGRNPFVGEDEKQNIVLQVKGKTGAREVVSRTPDVMIYFQRIHELRTQERDGIKPPLTESIFAHQDGKPIHSFKKGFNSLVKEAGVEFDGNGQRRVIYSLRHTYATFRLQEGVNHYVLARNMGTSVKMLENFYGHTSNRAMASELTKTRSKDRKKLPWEE